MAQQMEDDDVVPTTSASINLCDSENDSNDCDAAAQMANTASTSASATAAAAQQQQSTVLECPICLQTCIHPTRLPCGHIFCFLCVKGVAYKNRRCAMCRREIPPEFLDHPQLVNGIDDICTTKATEDGYQWFYEGRNGWWQYDDRTSQDIEEAYKKGEKSCTILVAGYVYIVDLETMVQQRQNEPSRCRRVKRDLATVPKKGVAGLRIEGNTVTTDSNFAGQRLYEQEYGQMPRLYHRPLHFQQYLQRHHLLANVIGDDDVDDDDVDEDDDDDEDGGRAAGRRPRQPRHNQLGLNLPLDYGLHLAGDAAGDFITSMTATDAAIRIASDIIGSTLAHADELACGVAARSGQQQQQSTEPETPNPTPTSAHASGGVSLLDSLVQAHGEQAAVGTSTSQAHTPSSATSQQQQATATSYTPSSSTHTATPQAPAYVNMVEYFSRRLSPSQQQQATSSSYTPSSSTPTPTPQAQPYVNTVEFFSRPLSPAGHHHHQQPLTGSSPSEQAPDSHQHQLHAGTQHSDDNSSLPPTVGSGPTRVASLLQRRIAARFIEPNELLNDFHALTLHNLADSDSEPEGGEASEPRASSTERPAASADGVGNSSELPAASSDAASAPATSPALTTPGRGADGGSSAKSSPTPASTPRHF